MTPVIQAAEKLARNKAQMLLKRAKPIATHLATNVAVVKMGGGDQLLPAAAIEIEGHNSAFELSRLRYGWNLARETGHRDGDGLDRKNCHNWPIGC